MKPLTKRDTQALSNVSPAVVSEWEALCHECGGHPLWHRAMKSEAKP